jgi:hypothetical protein
VHFLSMWACSRFEEEQRQARNGDRKVGVKQVSSGIADSRDSRDSGDCKMQRGLGKGALPGWTADYFEPQTPCISQ